MNKRRGASLIELMVVISMATAVLVMIGTIFHRMFQAEQGSARTALMERTTSRLAIQFRRDVHAARSAIRKTSPDGTAPILELKSQSDSTAAVVYFGGRDEVRRELVESGETKARETYRLPKCASTFPQLPDPDPAKPHIVSLVIERPHSTLTANPQAIPTLRGLALEAELGRDLRLGMQPASPSTKITSGGEAP